MSKVVLTKEQRKGLVEHIANELAPYYVNDENKGQVQSVILRTVSAINEYMWFDDIVIDLSRELTMKDYELTTGRTLDDYR